MSTFRTAVVTLVLSALTGIATAGDLSGHVHLRGAPAPERNRKHYTDSPDASAADTADPTNPVKDVVVYIEGAHGGQGYHPAAEISQHHKSFVPRVLPIRAGTSVSFPNRDSFYHNVFSYTPLKKFDLGRFATGQSRSISFDTPGVVRIFCEIHSQMKGFILIFDSDAFTVPDASGAYRITDVPPGHYRAIAWHPAFDPQVHEVDIGAGGTTVDFDF